MHYKKQSRPDTRHLPDSPGVYLFYGKNGELLYVGKSKTIRTRVRSHFSSHEERTMCRHVCHIEVNQTPGELGALLLESQLIKELQPMYNKQSRHKRRIIIARRHFTPEGYVRISLEAISHLDPASTQPIMGIFKTKTQAREYLSSVAKHYMLCPKLLGLEQTKRFCFSYHLKQCNGACMGREDARLYNERVEHAFEERRIKAWPFRGAVIIEEKNDEGSEGEVFVVDNWCLLYNFTYSHHHHSLRVRGLHRFDYDSYKILAGYVFDDSHRTTIRTASKEEIETLMRNARAA